MSDAYYYIRIGNHDGQIVGPLNFRMVRSWATRGFLSPSDQVCKNGETWTAASEVDGLLPTCCQPVQRLTRPRTAPGSLRGALSNAGAHIKAAFGIDTVSATAR